MGRAASVMFSATVKGANETLDLALGRNQADALGRGIEGGGEVHRFARNLQCAAVRPRMASEAPRQIFAARADDTRNAQNLALMQREADVGKAAGLRQVLGLRARCWPMARPAAPRGNTRDAAGGRP